MTSKPDRPSIEWQRARILSEAPEALRDVLHAEPDEVEGEELGARPEPVARPRSLSNALVSRLMDGRRRSVLAGGKGSGPCPFGYRRSGKDKSLVVVEHEAEVVRWIFKLYLQPRASVASVVEHLTADGSRTRRGKEWSKAGVAWILKNRTYVGSVAYGDTRARGNHAPIVAPISFNKAGVKMRKQTRRVARGGVE